MIQNDEIDIGELVFLVIYCYHPQTGKRTSGVYIHWSNYIKSTKETLCAQIIKDKMLVIIAAIPSKFALPHHQIMVLITLKYVYEYISMYKHASYIHTQYMLTMHLNTNKFLSFFKGSQSLHRKWPQILTQGYSGEPSSEDEPLLESTKNWCYPDDRIEGVWNARHACLSVIPWCSRTHVNLTQLI